MFQESIEIIATSGPTQIFAWLYHNHRKNKIPIFQKLLDICGEQVDLFEPIFDSNDNSDSDYKGISYNPQ